LGKHVRCQLTHGTSAFSHGVSVPGRRYFSKVLLYLRFFSLGILHSHADLSHRTLRLRCAWKP
jgi:hypothetical protein